MLTIEGGLINIIFRNEENGYTVAIMETDDSDITVVGNLPDAQIGKHYTLKGELVYHDRYGEQFKVESAIFSVPKSRTALIKYLSSGLIPYIGQKTAKKLVDLFGEQTLELIEEDPERLLEVKGLGKKRIAKIAEALSYHRNSRDTVVFLQELGLSTNQAIKIFAKYKEEAIARIKENPYQLIDDIRGIGFMLADSIAANNGIERASDFRISSGIRYLLYEAAMTNGDCFLPRNELVLRSAELLGLGPELIDNKLDMLIISSNLIQDNIEGSQVIYNEALYLSEELVATKLVQLLASNIERSQLVFVEQQAMDSIVLDEVQRAAVEEAANSKVLVITGGPGTGKTTIIKALVELAKANGIEIKLCAPTGRAAKRMEESTGVRSSTIHRLLKYKRDDNTGFMTFEHDRDNPLEADMLIVDEASMIDLELMERLMDAISLGSRLILVGDVDQLPSVGPGNVLRDIISSGLVRTMVLEKIYRQSEKSNIVVNAHRINHGLFPIVNEEGKDFFFIRSNDPWTSKGTILELVKKRLPAYYKLSPVVDIQILTPMKRGVVGLNELNRSLQEVLNPESESKGQIEYGDNIFRKGDKVMQLVNNYNLSCTDELGETQTGVFNGDMGIIDEVDTEAGELLVRFDDGSKTVYERSLLDELMHSYAVTVHKSQGSEFRVVIIPMHHAPKMLMTRNLIYTAITRAKELVVIVGDEEILRQMIANNMIRNRNSSLAYRMRLKNTIYLED